RLVHAQSPPPVGELLQVLVAIGLASSAESKEPIAPTDAPGSTTMRRSRLRQAGAQIHESTTRFETPPQAELPELFDRRGRLRTKLLTKRLLERTGGKQWLSGDELLALEQAADARADRPPSAT